MSLHDDFGMYYNGTYVGVKGDNGHIKPFWVECIENDEDIFDLENANSAQAHGEEAMNALVFRGIIHQQNGNNDRHRESMINDRLVLDLPDPQYVKIRNRYHWVSYRASRSTKKGICDRRVVCTAPFNIELVKAMYNQGDDENIIGRVFLKNGTDLDYKGVNIGTIDGDNITLCAEAAHLSRELQKELPQCQIQVSPAG